MAYNISNLSQFQQNLTKHHFDNYTDEIIGCVFFTEICFQTYHMIKKGPFQKQGAPLIVTTCQGLNCSWSRQRAMLWGLGCDQSTYTKPKFLFLLKFLLYFTLFNTLSFNWHVQCHHFLRFFLQDFHKKKNIKNI